jgi:poly(hydroxyalkanoate) depolymerase family esterase
VVARSGGVVAALFAAIVLATAAPAADERVVRGVHQGRTYRLSLPPTPAPARPLIVALHGCGQTPDDFALGTRLDQAAARRGLRVLYPAQGATDNPARCWNWWSPRTPAGGEVGEILALVREMQRVHQPNSGRIVVLGLSAGGYMAVNLLCAAPDLVVGVGVAAGGPYRCAETSRGPVACMRGEHLDAGEAASRCVKAGGKAPAARASLWQGERDPVVRPLNLTALTLMFVDLRKPSDSRKLGDSGRPPSPLTSTPTVVNGAVRTVYRAADGRPVIESWLVSGMPHAWSGGDARGTHTYPAGPDATEAMLRFLVDD